MKTGAGIVIGLSVALAAGGGYWLGQRPVAGHPEPSVAVATTSVEGMKKERKLLYYRNPMGLPDTSPMPKKDPMGMDYVPVYEGEADEPPAANSIKISTEKVQKLGVRTEAAELRALDKQVRAAGRIEIDERRSFAISPKFEGYVERLHVNVTGQPVAKGQPLFEVYSPELVSAQREYTIAAQGVDALKDAGSEARSGMQQLAESSLLRLRNWDISEEQIRALAKSGASKRTLTFRSPVSGVVTEKKAVQGMRFMPGDTLNAETRTVPVRVELANPGQLLKPAMFAQVEVPVGGKGQVVTVPASAVIDSGTRQIVLIARGEGRFEPREVKLGARSDTHLEVLSGVKAGEEVVVAANFLIDAESNLKAAVGGFGHSGHGAAPKSEKDGDKAALAPKTAGHRAEGSVDEVDAKAGTVSLSHGPVASLKWPAMTMEFKVANPSLLQTLKPGAKVDVEFVERQPGEWVITSAVPASKAATPVPAANPHTGH